MQLNTSYGNQVYLPYSIGILKAVVGNDEKLSLNYSFNDFLFIREPARKIAERIGTIDVLDISVYVWNWLLSRQLAIAVRKNNPHCLIIFGGPQVPNYIDGFFDENPHVDQTCHGEGEQTFENILSNLADGISLRNIRGTTFHDRATRKVYKNPSRERMTDLNLIPSPYLNGTFDSLLKEPEFSWMATWETNRGCPFKCSFCDWGSAIATKVRQFSDNRLIQEVKFFSDKKIDLVLGRMLTLVYSSATGCLRKS